MESAGSFGTVWRALLAAADEFAEHGLGASVADIARRAGVGKGTVFRHFATKDDLTECVNCGAWWARRRSRLRALRQDTVGAIQL